MGWRLKLSAAWGRDAGQASFKGRRCSMLATLLTRAKRLGPRQTRTSRLPQRKSRVDRRPLRQSHNEEFRSRVNRPARSGRPVRCTGKGESPPRNRVTPTGKHPRRGPVPASKSKAPPQGPGVKPPSSICLKGLRSPRLERVPTHHGASRQGLTAAKHLDGGMTPSRERAPRGRRVAQREGSASGGALITGGTPVLLPPQHHQRGVVGLACVAAVLMHDAQQVVHHVAGGQALRGGV